MTVENQGQRTAEEAAREWEAAKFGAAREMFGRMLNNALAAFQTHVPARPTARSVEEASRLAVDETLKILVLLLRERLQLRAEAIHEASALASRASIEALQAEIQPLVDDSLRRFEEFCETNSSWIGNPSQEPARTALADINSKAQSLGKEARYQAAALAVFREKSAEPALAPNSTSSTKDPDWLSVYRLRLRAYMKGKSIDEVVAALSALTDDGGGPSRTSVHRCPDSKNPPRRDYYDLLKRLLADSSFLSET